MKHFVINFLLLIFIICTAYAEINLVFGGDFTRVGAKKSSGLAVYHSTGGWLDLHLAPPYGNSITAMAPAPGGNGSAWIASQDTTSGFTNVYYFDGTLYHLLGYSFEGTIYHLWYSAPTLYATGSFTYLYTPATEDTARVLLSDFASFNEPTVPGRSKRWVPAAGQNPNRGPGGEGYRVPGGGRQGFHFGSDLIMIRNSNNELYWNRQPSTPDPDAARSWTDNFDDVSGTNLNSASVSEIQVVNSVLYLWGAFTFTADASVFYGVVSTTDGIQFTSVYNNATLVGRYFSQNTVAIASGSQIYTAEPIQRFAYGANRYRIIGVTTPSGQPTQIGYWFDNRPSLLWANNGYLYAYFSTLTSYYIPNSASNLDDLPEYGRALYITENGFIRYNLNSPSDWEPALGGGVEGTVDEAAAVGEFTYVRGAITETYDVTAFGLAGWDNDEETWISLGNPLIDVPNSDRYPGALRKIIAVYFDEDNGNVVFGGEFATINNVTFNSIGVRSGENGALSPLGQGLSRSTNDMRYDSIPGKVHAIEQVSVTADATTWVVGGSFSYAGDVTVRNIALWDGTIWSPLRAGVSGPVWAIEMFEDDIIVGGNFQTAGNIHAPYIARWDTENEEWLPMSVGTDGPVYTIFNDHGTLYIGGDFDAASGVKAYGAAVWNNDKAVWDPISCETCNRDCRNPYDRPLYCLTNTDVVYEIRSVQDQGLFFRVGGNLYLWNGDEFERVTSGVSIQQSSTEPQRLISSNDLSSEMQGSLTIAGISGGPFFDDNVDVGSLNQDGYINYHTYGGIDGNIYAVSSSSVLKPIIALVLSFLAVMFL